MENEKVYDGGWKELQIDNLPPDILTGDYRFGMKDPGDLKVFIYSEKVDAYQVIEDLGDGNTYYYRKPEPKAPTHVEIMTKWWNLDHRWYRVSIYDPLRSHNYFIYNTWCDAQHLGTLKSADIPPEE